MPGKKKTVTEEVSIIEIEQGRFEVYILGRSPLIFNAMSSKVRQGLLLPKKKTAADKAATLKHNPPDEYRSSVYRTKGEDEPTRLLLPAVSFKKAMSGVAIDIPGAAKAQISRLTWVEGDYIHIYGVPKLLMSVVRSADMNRTPDIRTRAILPEWACRLAVTYTRPMLREKDVVNLLAAAGVLRGVGDWRQEKGSGSYGQFALVAEKDKPFAAVMKAGGRAAQDAALADPECYDVESAELLAWYHSEVSRRGFDQPALGKSGGNGGTAHVTRQQPTV